MQTVLNVLHLFLAIGLVGLVLIQHGKGADAGAAFGSGASATVFGARGSGNFLSRATAALATLFFLTSMALAYYASQVGEPQGLMERADVPAGPAAPAPAPVEMQKDVPVVPRLGGDEALTDVPTVPPTTAPASGDTPEAPMPSVAKPEAATAAPVPEPEASVPAVDAGAQ